jgi:type IX secretion system substrate protein
MKYIITFVFAAGCFLQSESQVYFNKRLHFGFPAAVLTSIVPTDSCYYATGIIADSIFPYNTGAIFLRLDLDGQPQLVKTLRSTQKNYGPWFNDLHILSDGTFAVSAETFDSTLKTMLIKYNSTGDTLFTREYFNPYFPEQFFMQPRGGVAPTKDGGFVINNWIRASEPNANIYVIKTDSLGNVIWNKILGDSKWDRPASILTTEGGNIIVGGIKTNDNMTTENYSYQTYITQLDSIGNIEWQYLSPIDSGLRDAANDMMLSDDGSLAVASGAGTELDRPSVNVVYFDKYVFKLNPDGEIEWELTFKDPELTSVSRTTNLIQLSNGSGFLLAGMAHVKLSPILGSVMGWIAKITPEGDSTWIRRYAFLDQQSSAHTIYDLKETPDGGFILCGEARDYSGTDSIPQQAWLLKLDEYGCLVPGCYTATEEPAGGEPAISLAIYPNPASDYLNFYLRTLRPVREASFRIVNAEGRLMKTFQSDRPGATYIVPVWDWPAGVYFLQYVEEGVVRASEKFVKQ